MYSRVYEFICKLHKNGSNLFPRENPYGQIENPYGQILANSIPVTVYWQDIHTKIQLQFGLSTFLRAVLMKSTTHNLRSVYMPKKVQRQCRDTDLSDLCILHIKQRQLQGQGEEIFLFPDCKCCNSKSL